MPDIFSLVEFNRLLQPNIKKLNSIRKQLTKLIDILKLVSKRAEGSLYTGYESIHPQLKVHAYVNSKNVNK